VVFMSNETKCPEPKVCVIKRATDSIRADFAQLIDLARHSRYLIKFDSASEPLAQAVEHLPFKQRVAGSNPARLTSTSPSSSSAQDTGLSRR
jgi:hypothetical protein